MTTNNEHDHIEEMLDEEEAAVEAEQQPDLAAKLKEAEDKLLRQAADADNYRKRLVRETDEKIKYANQALLSKFLPVLDNFDLALQHTEGVTVESVIEGVMLTRKALLDVLDKAGLSVIPVETGSPFDPNLHEAIMLACNNDMPDNSITLVAQKGYKLADRILRPAKVQVNKLQN